MDERRVEQPPGTGVPPSGPDRTKLVAVVSVTVVVAVVLAGYLLFGGGGDDDAGATGRTSTTTQAGASVSGPSSTTAPDTTVPGTDPSEDGLAEAAQAFADLLAEDDTDAAYRYFDDQCRDRMLRRQFRLMAEQALGPEMANARHEVEQAEVAPGSTVTGTVYWRVTDVSDAPEVPPIFSPDASWRYDLEQARWVTDGCDGRVLGRYTPDETGFVQAASDFFNWSAGPDVDRTYPFLAAMCRRTITLDDYTANAQAVRSELGTALGVDLSAMSMTGMTGLKLGNAQGTGVPTLDMPPEVRAALEPVGGLDVFGAPITLVYEQGVWRSVDCAQFAPIEDTAPFSQPP